MKITKRHVGDKVIAEFQIPYESWKKLRNVSNIVIIGDKNEAFRIPNPHYATLRFEVCDKCGGSGKVEHVGEGLREYCEHCVI